MRKNLPELTIRYDQRNRCFVLSASRKGSIRYKEKTRPFSVEWPIEELKTHPDRGEKVIGAAVLAFFDQVSESGLGLKDYRTQGKLDEKKIVADLEVSANNNDSSAQYSLAMLLLRRAAKERSLKDVKDAEKWLRAAAKGGNDDASTYLKDSWSKAAQAITERIRAR
jgi:hypothetical protein